MQVFECGRVAVTVPAAHDDRCGELGDGVARDDDRRIEAFRRARAHADGADRRTEHRRASNGRSQRVAPTEEELLDDDVNALDRRASVEQVEVGTTRWAFEDETQLIWLGHRRVTEAVGDSDDGGELISSSELLVCRREVV